MVNAVTAATAAVEEEEQEQVEEAGEAVQSSGAGVHPTASRGPALGTLRNKAVEGSGRR